MEDKEQQNLILLKKISNIIVRNCANVESAKFLLLEAKYIKGYDKLISVFNSLLSLNDDIKKKIEEIEKQ